jgi:hypothetical protein
MLIRKSFVFHPSLYRFCSFREESDTFGPIKVKSDRLWGA